MGFSIPLATYSLLKKTNSNRWRIFRKIFVRFVKMFIIGLMLNSRFGVELVNLRIFGVLQRIAICYLIVASLELFLYKPIKLEESGKSLTYFITDLIWSKFHLLIMLLILLIWFLLTYLVKVPGCPSGYMGPGGLDNYGMYANCTGGIAGYFDKIIFGKSHLYGRPTAMKIYKTTEPFDPEGVFGVFNSVILTYMGVQAGRAIIFYKSTKFHLILWFLWGWFCLIIYCCITQFDMANGWVPVNKNLWTFSYTLVTGSSSFFILGFFIF